MRSFFPRIFIFTLITLLFLSFDIPQLFQQKRIDPPFAGEPDRWVDSVFNSLTLEQKIGQLFMVAAYSNRDSEHVDEVARLISEYNIGGLIFFQGGPVRQAKLTNHYQSVAQTPLMIAMDAEWGLGMRLDSTLSYPRQMTLGAIQDDQLIYRMGAEIARQMKRLGVHVNFAPVLDINNNPENPVIGSRSFGEDKWSVARKAFFYMKGMQDNNILAVGKHFPGHGDTDTDSHYDLPVMMHTRERLDSLELFPFRHLINSGIGGLMTAHIHMPLLDPTPNLASTLSPRIINKLLVDELGFNGLIFTDALNMKGVSDYFPPGTVELISLIAGNDMMVFPEDVPKAVEIIKNEVEKGNFPEEEINRRCKKILMAKFWLGLNDTGDIETDNLYNDLNGTEASLLKRKLIGESITLVSNPGSLIPFSRLDTLKIATVAIGRNELSSFQETISLYAPVSHYNLSPDAGSEERESFVAGLDIYNMVVVGMHGMNRRVSDGFGIKDGAAQFVEQLSERNNVVLSVFGSPYGLSRLNGISGLSSLAVAYEDEPEYGDLAAQMLFGGIMAKGRLPVHAAGKFRQGTGYITRDKVRLAYSMPEETGLNTEKLNRIDSIVHEAITAGASPGAQVLVARNGMVAFHKAYGYHTYQEKVPVRKTDLYDLASVTKIASTALVLMKLKDDGDLDIYSTLGENIPELEGTNKEDLAIKDVLTHQAGLEPWIPFHFSFFESYLPQEEAISRSFSGNYPHRLGSARYLTRNYKFAEGIFSRLPSREFSIHVASGMYMNHAYTDTIFKRIAESDVRSRKKYLYSDLGYYYMKQIAERKTGVTIDRYVQNRFYSPLGAGTLTYRPLNRFPAERIVPTENDVYFRRQLLQGYVHDPGAALLGGGGGHAGLFSNANDLAKLMQMYLQGGEYGGTTFLSREVLDYFTGAHKLDNDNRRGIAFDKPERNPSRNGPAAKDASENSYGHSGYTGTIVWVDPDEQLVYIFLSNRVHPDQFNNKLIEKNIRTRIQQVIYDSIIKE